MSKLGNKVKVLQILISRCLNNIMDELHSLNSTSKRHLITNVILASDHIHFSDIDIGCMSVQNLHSTSNSYLTTNVILPSDHRHFLDINIWIKMYLCTFNEKQTCIRCSYAGLDVPAYPIVNTHSEIYISLYTYIYFSKFLCRHCS